MEGGWFDSEALESERFDADREMASLERQGIRAAAAAKRSAAFRSAGELVKAADACRHGWGYGTPGLAADHAGDPRAKERGFRCHNCGSFLSASPWDGGRVLYPCELPGVSS